MKRMLITLLALALLAGLTPALAEYPYLPQEYALAENTELSTDLNGDGIAETVYWAMTCGLDGEGYDRSLLLYVKDRAGNDRTYPTEIIYGESVYVLDLDGDGTQEILLTGDVMSDDYVTYCLRYIDGQLYELLFPDNGRGDYNYGYENYGYGQLVSIGDNVLALSGSQDMLGTWFATRMFRLTPALYFEYADNYLWERDLENWSDEDLWEYAALTTSIPLEYNGIHGYPSGTLPAGTKLVVYATNKQDTVWFFTQDDITGTFSVSQDYDKGWGWMVNGIAEEDCFEYVPYAD